MTTLTPYRRLAATEFKLYLREPVAVFFAIALPVGLLLILGGTMPGLSDPDPAFNGLRGVDTHMLGMMTLLSVVTVAFTTLPTALVVYRERGVLRRLSTTPVKPSAVLGAQLLINVATALAAVLLMIVSGHFVLGIPIPGFGYAGVLVLGSIAMFCIGLLLAAVSANSRVVQGGGAALMFPLLFFAGVWLPRSMMPEWLRTVSDFTPTGAFGGALTDALTGVTPSMLHLGVLVGWAVLTGFFAAKLFRWE